MGGGTCRSLLKRRPSADGRWGLGDDALLRGDPNDDSGVGEGPESCRILFMLHVVIAGMISAVTDEIHSLTYVV